jgi:DNA-binding beta-propeller fold protein YncE
MQISAGHSTFVFLLPSVIWMLMRDMLRPGFGSLLLVMVGCWSFAAPSLTITNVAGNGTKGFSGDGGPATEAQLNFPTGISRGPDGALYICDTLNHRIRKVAVDGIITTIAGTGVGGWSGDGGTATSAKLNEPYEIRFDSTGNIFWVERVNHCVRKLDSRTGILSTIAGTGAAGFSGDDGPAIRAQLNEPHSIGFDKADNLYICDVKNHRIRKVDMKTGKISTCAGTGEKKPTLDGASLLDAPLYGPRALDFDQAGNLWLALREGNAVYRLDLKPATVHHEAGTGKKGFTGNGGPAKEADLSGPKGVAVAPSGNIYFADTESHSIRMIDSRTKTIHLVAGTGTAGDGSESDPLKCQLSRPHGIFVDKDGSIFIGDSEAQRVRVIRVDKP